MSASRLGLCLTALLLGPPAWAATETGVSASAEVRTAGPAGQVGTTLTGPTGQLQLQLPLAGASLSPALRTPQVTPVLQASPLVLAQPLPLPSAAPGLLPPSDESQAALPAPEAQAGLDGPQPGTTPQQTAHPVSDESLGQNGRAIFDQASASPGPILPPDEAPDWPGQTGDRVRIAGQTYELGEKLGEGTSAWVYRVRGRDLIVKLISPELKDIEVFGGEREALAAMSKTDIPHAALRAISADGLVLVKDLVVGTPMYQVGRLDAAQRAGLAELMAKLVRIGHTADLNMGNLYWTARGWVLVDAGGFAPASPWGPLGQYLSKERSQATGFPPAELLAAVRQRLGADSTQWQAVLDSAKYPHQKQALAALAAADATGRP